MCEQTDEAIAEYLMSCLSPVPLPDLATKADVALVKADVVLLKDDVLLLKSDIERVESKVDWLVEVRESDRKESQTQFRWIIGLGATSFGVLLAAMFALAAITLTA